MNEFRRVAARAVIDHDVLAQRAAALLQSRLGRLIFPVQMRVLNTVHAANGVDASSGREVSLHLCEFVRVVRLVGRVEKDQSRIAVRRVDRLPVRRQSGRRGSEWRVGSERIAKGSVEVKVNCS